MIAQRRPTPRRSICGATPSERCGGLTSGHPPPSADGHGRPISITGSRAVPDRIPPTRDDATLWVETVAIGVDWGGRMMSEKRTAGHDPSRDGNSDKPRLVHRQTEICALSRLAANLVYL